MKKKRLSLKQRKVERLCVDLFLRTEVKKAPKHMYVLTRDLYRAYKKGRGGKTPLSVDGFGKMLPYPRKTVFVKGARRAVFGVTFRD